MSENTSIGELVKIISDHSDIKEEVTRDFIHSFARVINSALENNGSVIIPDFGKFELREMTGHKSDDPQTGLKTNIPAQDKIIFIPSKSLEDQVNRPYSRIQPQILDHVPVDKSDPGQRNTKAESDMGGQTHNTIGHERPKKEKNIGKTEPLKQSENDDKPFDNTSLERDSVYPEDTDPKEAKMPPYPFYLEEVEKYEETEDESEELITIRPSPVEQRRASHEFIEKTETQEEQKKGRFLWPYLAAAVIFVIIVLALYYFMSNWEDTTVQTVDIPEVEVVPDPGITEPAPANVEGTELITIIVQEGQSLWNLALNYLGNAYLWPWIYYLNSDRISDPNIIDSDIDLAIPIPDDPGNLPDEYLHEIALGYIGVYQWYKENNPYEARNYLWAAGSIYPDILDQVVNDVEPDDLNFAKNR